MCWQGKSCKARGCLGRSGRCWPCRLEELPCSPFKERLKRPCEASTVCRGSAGGDIATVQTQERKEDRAHGPIWSCQPGMAATSLHRVRLPASITLCCPHCPWGRGGQGQCPCLHPSPEEEPWAGGGCSRQGVPGQGSPPEEWGARHGGGWHRAPRWGLLCPHAGG